jgi:hypothetical protein
VRHRRSLIDGASLLREWTLQLLCSHERTDKLCDGMEDGAAFVPMGLASRA